MSEARAQTGSAVPSLDIPDVPPAGRRPWYHGRSGERALVALVFIVFLAAWAAIVKVMNF